MTVSSSSSNHSNMGQFGDTTLTKVFVGGLAWETTKELLRDHFEKYGKILEAVIISDKATGRSKGYGFVTFKEAEAANKACEDANPIIHGRRANFNLASLGACRQRASSTPPPPPFAAPLPQQVMFGKGGHGSARPLALTPANQVQWYYPVGVPATPYLHQQHHVNPYYGYTPTYFSSGINYNHNLSYLNGGSYMNSHSSPLYPSGQPVVGSNTTMPVYAVCHIPQMQMMGIPAAHTYQQATPTSLSMVPARVSKRELSLPLTQVHLVEEEYHGGRRGKMASAKIFDMI